MDLMSKQVEGLVFHRDHVLQTPSMNSDRCGSHIALLNPKMLHTKTMYILMSSVCACTVSKHMSDYINCVLTIKLVNNYENYKTEQLAKDSKKNKALIVTI